MKKSSEPRQTKKWYKKWWIWVIIIIFLIIIGLIVLSGYLPQNKNSNILPDNDRDMPQDEISLLLADLKSTTNLPFSEINNKEFDWNRFATQDMAVDIVAGKSIELRNYQAETEQVKAYFLNNGFVIDVNNVAAGTIAWTTGYQKNDLVCLVNEGISGFEQADKQWIPTDTSKHDLIVSCGYYEIKNNDQVGDVPFDVAVNQEFKFALASNPTTGYQWSAQFDENYLQLVSQDYQAESDLIGAGGMDTFTFRALKTGQANITLNYARPWESVTPIDTKIYQVNITE